jgi:hypothetical protein
MAPTPRWTSVGLSVLAATAVMASIVSPLTAVVAGPTVLVASILVLRRVQAPGTRGVALLTATVGAGLCLLVVVVGLMLVAV